MTVKIEDVQIGDFAKINHEVYGDFIVGNEYKVVGLGSDWIGLVGEDGDASDDGTGCVFMPSEIDSVRR